MASIFFFTAYISKDVIFDVFYTYIFHGFYSGLIISSNDRTAIKNVYRMGVISSNKVKVSSEEGKSVFL